MGAFKGSFPLKNNLSFIFLKNQKVSLILALVDIEVEIFFKVLKEQDSPLKGGFIYLILLLLFTFN